MEICKSRPKSFNSLKWVKFFQNFFPLVFIEQSFDLLKTITLTVKPSLIIACFEGTLFMNRIFKQNFQFSLDCS